MNFPYYRDCLVGKICSYVISRVILWVVIVKRFKNSQNHPYGQPNGFSHLSTPNLQFKLSEPFEWTWIELNFNTKENLLCLGFISLYLCFFLCFIFKSLWYLRAAFWVMLHAMFCYMFHRKQPAQRLNWKKRLLTISKINITWWNMNRDNNFHPLR